MRRLEPKCGGPAFLPNRHVEMAGKGWGSFPLPASLVFLSKPSRHSIGISLKACVTSMPCERRIIFMMK